MAFPGISKVALFLDVDITLTRKPVQSVYAQCLNCHDEYSNLERDLGTGAINSQEFGRNLVDLFASRGFTKNAAKKFYPRVEKQSWVSINLNRSVDVFLVSAGPDYFVELLAKDLIIPAHRVLSSTYAFCDRTGIVNACIAVTPEDKAAFVRRHAGRYSALIGIGDCSRSDGPFLAACTIGLLYNPQDDMGNGAAGAEFRFLDSML